MNETNIRELSRPPVRLWPEAEQTAGHIGGPQVVRLTPSPPRLSKVFKSIGGTFVDIAVCGGRGLERVAHVPSELLIP